MTFHIIIKGKVKPPPGTWNDKITRPNHPDFCTTSELKKQGFTGMRHNSLTNDIEIWTLGDLRAKAPASDRKKVAETYAAVFGIEQVAYSEE